MPQEIKRWKCDHCKKHFADKKYTEQHERKCFFNLNNRTCPTCRNFNGNFDVDYAKCSKLDRKGSEILNSETDFMTEEPYEVRKYASFTDFLIYNCPDWESNCYIPEEDEDCE